MNAMRLFLWTVLLNLLGTPLAFAQAPSEAVCQALREPEFFEDFKHAITESEVCSGACEITGARMRDHVDIHVLPTQTAKANAALLTSTLNWVIDDIESTIGNSVTISIVESLAGSTASRIVILPVDRDINRVFMHQGLPDFSSEDYQAFHRSIVLRGYCSARAISLADENQTVIDLVYILVPAEMLNDADALDLCLLEEMSQSFGIFGDPPGTESLFDDGNIDLTADRPRTSPKTKAMLAFLYSGYSLDPRGLGHFLDAGCAS